MATKYDKWKTSAPDMNSEEWTDAVEDVADEIGSVERAEMIQTLAAATGALDWISGAVIVPAHHLAAFRDLIKMADTYRDQVEDAMKVFRDPRD